MARGGMEALLTEANARGYGFEHDLAVTPSVGGNYYNDCQGKALCKLQGRIHSHGVAIYNSPDSLTNPSC